MIEEYKTIDCLTCGLYINNFLHLLQNMYIQPTVYKYLSSLILLHNSQCFMGMGGAKEFFWHDLLVMILKLVEEVFPPEIRLLNMINIS